MTLVEVLVVLAVIAIVVVTMAMSVRSLASPIDTATNLLEGFLRQARLNAIASTSAYRVTPNGGNALAAASASTCSATTWTNDPKMTLTLPAGVAMTPSLWSVCFGSRGISANNVVITLQHPTNRSRKVEVLLGGTTRVVP